MNKDIIIDIEKDKSTFDNLVEYCGKNNYTFKLSKMSSLGKEIGLSKMTITDRNGYGFNSIPKYPLYKQLILNYPNYKDTSTLLEFLGLFYDVKVSYNIYEDKISFFFNNNITPYYITDNDLEKFEELFYDLLGFRFITNNPVIETVLSRFPDNNISKLKGYNIWYCHPLANIKFTLAKLKVLLDKGYFCPPRGKLKGSSKQVYMAYEYCQVGKKCNCENKRQFDCTCVYGETIKYTDKNFYKIPIVGLKFERDNFNEDFFKLCLKYVDSGEVPEIVFKLDFQPDRRARVSVISSYIETMCGENAVCNFVKSKEDKELQCRQKEPCTYLSPKMLVDIKIEKDGKYGLITLKCGNSNALEIILNSMKRNVDRITIFNVKNIRDGINVRSKYFYNKSLLLEDDEGFYVGVWDLDMNTEIKTSKPVTLEKLEYYASLKDNYSEYGQNYEHVGLYEISHKGETILPGILSSIPYPEPLDIKIDNVVFRTVGNVCNLYLRPEMSLILSTESEGKSKRDIISLLRDTVRNYTNGDLFTDWGKSYISKYGHEEVKPENFDNIFGVV